MPVEQELPLMYTDYLADLEDGVMRIRLTHQCNCKCEFCYQQYWSEEEQNASLDPKIFYEYCKPLYNRLKYIAMGGGEITYAKEGYNYTKFIAENYPHINIFTESNGLLYNEKWQKLAAKHMFAAHFSVNAATPEIYTKSCWKEGGAEAYKKLTTNIQNLIKEQESVGLKYATSIAMVVNSTSAADVYDFVKMSLKWRCKGIMFYFDTRESSADGKGFKNPEIMDNALRLLMKIERLLARRYMVYFRLWLPMNCTQRLQSEIESIPIEELKKEFADLLELVKERDMIKEYEEREALKKTIGKKPLSIEEDYSPFLYTIDKLLSDGSIKKNICMAPFKMIDLFASGRLDLCGWMKRPMLNIKDFIKNDTINWAEVLNQPIFCNMRKKALDSDFSYCMDCCPLNPQNPHLNDIFKYSLKRKGY